MIYEYSIGKLGDDLGGLPAYLSVISTWVSEHEFEIKTNSETDLTEIKDLLQLIPEEYDNPKVCHYLARLLQELLTDALNSTSLSDNVAADRTDEKEGL